MLNYNICHKLYLLFYCSIFGLIMYIVEYFTFTMKQLLEETAFKILGILVPYLNT